jgi:hypothetical protein
MDGRDLGALRQNWEEIEAEETRLLQQMTVQKGISQLLALHRIFEPQFQQTESIFRAEREAHLVELQQRLQKLAEWMKEQRGGEPASVGGGSPKAA